MAIVRMLVFVLAVAAVAALAKLAFERVAGRSLRLRYAFLGVFLLLIALFVAHKLNQPGDGERIEHRLETLGASGDPRVCDEAMTERYLEQITGEGGAFALTACEAGVSENRPDELAVSGVEVDGDRATAVEATKGGPIDGSSLRVALVKENREWKLDRRIAFVTFDRARFRHEYLQGFLRFGSPRTAIACASRGERRLTDSEIKAAILGGGSRRLFAPIAVECDREGVERSTMSAFADFKPHRNAVACMEARVRSLPDSALARVSSRYPTFDALVASCDPTAFHRYLRQELTERDVDPDVIACVLTGTSDLSAPAAIRLIYDDEAIDERTRACERAG